ncbi:precorrin-6y C5,15-methyltransferase (decarboxylating) subunit CbiE [Dactylosporangium sp. CA-139066]|uniref:precorrin-6y C5,15-methyltransferase (decarboxylating) subunit CbiE n=1 Tax=Dactylosporangium sp. CA-139066 TaxID=3239930 RepID=UPI003D913313
MRLTVGIGARPAATPAEILALLQESLPSLDDVVTVSTVDARLDLARAVAAERGWAVVGFGAEELADVSVPSPSTRVASALGIPSVAEAAALLAATRESHGGAAVLIVGKRASPVATIAVAAPAPEVTVVGIGADGHAGLSEAGRNAIDTADVVFGGPRQLALLPPRPAAAGRGEIGLDRALTPRPDLVAWPSPLVPALPRLLAEQHGRRVCVLASGDPMHYGIGTTLVRLLGAGHVHAVPHPSSMALACARLGWAQEDVDVVSAVGRSVDALRRHLHDGRRILVLSSGADTPAEVWRILEESGFEASDVTVLEALGGGDERVHRDPGAARGLNIVAVECRGDGGLSVVPGLGDETYDSDGQLTKREIRAVTLAVLGPRPGELLWDVGGGSGSIGIEWMRAHRSCRAVAVERDPVRAERIRGNARRLGVPELGVVVGAAPEACDGLDAPDAVFVGGGFTADGVFERCWDRLKPGGRLVVNAVTVESERLVGELHARHGGELTRLAVNRAAPVGGFLGWRPMLPVTQWVVRK